MSLYRDLLTLEAAPGKTSLAPMARHTLATNRRRAVTRSAADTATVSPRSVGRWAREAAPLARARLGSRARRRLAGHRELQSCRVAHWRVDSGERRAPGRRLGAGRLRRGRIGAPALEPLRHAPRRRGLCLVSRRVQQPGRGLADRLHPRAADLRRMPGARGARRARLPGRPARRPRRTRGAFGRVRKHDPGARPASGAGLRPHRPGMLAMPRNLLDLTSAPELFATLDRLGLVLGLVWAPALAALAVWRIVRLSAAARLLAAPVLLAATAYLMLVAAAYAHSLDRGFLSNDSIDQRLWFGQAAALGALVLGVVLAWARGWRARTEVARLVIELSDAPAPGRLRDALARALDDPALELAYPLGPGRHVDAHGHAVALPDGQRPRGDAAGTRRAASRRPRPPTRAGRRSGAARGGRRRRRPCARPRAPAGREARAAPAAPGVARPDRRSRRQRAPRTRARPARRCPATARGALVRAAAAARRARRRPRRTARRGRSAAACRTRRAARARPRDLPGRPRRRRARHRDRGARRGRTSADRDRFAARRAPGARSRSRRLLSRRRRRQAERATGITVRASESNGRLHIEIESTGTLDDNLVELEDRIGALDGELTVVG